MSAMSSRKHRGFTPQQKADAVALVRKLGNLAQVARDLDLAPSALHRWVQRAEIDEAASGEGPLTTQERDELRRLKREVATLRQERDFLKKAAAFFAKDDDRRSS
jgi:transposase-like protein